MPRTLALTALVALALLAPGRTVAQKEEAKQVQAGDDQQLKADVAAVKAYLEKTKPGKKWDVGPVRIDSADIRRAYPQARFYYVTSTVPGPLITGVAPTPEAVAAHQKAGKEKMEKFISQTLRIDPDGKVSAADYNAGLMPVQSEADARVAAAAILSLHQESNGPVHVPAGPIAAKDVKVTKTDKGWTCTAPLANSNLGFAGTWGGSGTVTINGGQVAAVNKQVKMVAPYMGPYPPSAPKK